MIRTKISAVVSKNIQTAEQTQRETLLNVKIIFDVPTDTELKSYNAMPCSALNSDRLTGLGWKAEFDMKKGAIHTVNLLRENM